MRRCCVVILASALALTGCSSASKPKAATPASTATASSPSPTTSGEATPEPSGSSTPSAGVTVVQTQTVTTAISKTGRIVLGISAIQVRGKLAVVDVNFSVDLPDKSTDQTLTLFELNGNSFIEPNLIDTINLKRYATVSDTLGHSLSSGDLARVTNGRTTATSFTFAAPPVDVQSLDFHLGKFPPFRDVPVTR